MQIGHQTSVTPSGDFGVLGLALSFAIVYKSSNSGHPDRSTDSVNIFYLHHLVTYTGSSLSPLISHSYIWTSALARVQVLSLRPDHLRRTSGLSPLARIQVLLCTRDHRCPSHMSLLTRTHTCPPCTQIIIPTSGLHTRT